MQTFLVLLRCLPGFGFLGIGLYLVLTALVPSWREEGWKSWKFYGRDDADNPISRLVTQLGFARQPRPLAEGEFDEKTAVLFYAGIGIFFSLLGIGLIALIVQLSLNS